MKLLQPHRFVGAGGISLAADVGGDRRGRPVILSHGAGQTRWSWGHTAQRLAEQGFWVISLDLRGHGESDWTAAENYSIDAFAGDIRCVAATLHQAPALIGASLGGIASLVAIGEGEPGLASALVMVDVTPRVETAGKDRIGQFMNAHANGFASLKEAADAIAAFTPHRRRSKNPTGLMKNLRKREDGRLYWHWDPSFLSGEIQSYTDHTRFLNAAHNVNVPTLLVRAGASDIVSVEGAKELLDIIPGAEYVEITKARHMIAGDSNQDFSAAAINFLSRRLTGS